MSAPVAPPGFLPDWVVDLLDDVVRHPLRSALTSISVAWGTYMLVVLLGLGEGLQNAVRYQFRDDATNSVWLYTGQTSIPYGGYPLGRRIVFDDDDIAAIDTIPEVDKLTGRFYAPGRDLVLAHADRKAAFGVRAVHPDHRFLENTQMVSGRYLDPLDLDEKRKVIVIGREIARFLFGEPPHDRILGTWIEVAGNPFQIIGVFTDAGGEGEESEAYLPITTARTVFNGGDRIDQIMFTVDEDATLEEVEALTTEVHAHIAKAHHIHPDDRKALRVRNNVERFQKLSSVFDRLANFVWVVGIGTVLAGIVGVSNIMLVSVKERTVEIGLRKALGETPRSLVIRVVREAVLLTAVSGYAGVVAGVGAVEAIDTLVPANETLRNPTVELDVALFATVLLTLAGAAAGFVPAWRAASVKPIVALRGDA